MIGMVERLLKRWGLIPQWDDDDLINAQIEDKQRDHETVTARLHEAFGKRLATNEALRESIKIAKERTNSFEAFERQMVGRRHANH